jgi:hypothetical protein
MAKQRDETIGAKQRAAGRRSPGRRGKYKFHPEKLRAEVRQRHSDLPSHTWNDVCSRVAEHVGCSTETVRKATRDLKWPDPRSVRSESK